MTELEDLDFETLIGKSRRTWFAWGDTYPHREVFKSWAWHWDPETNQWINDNGVDEDDPQIQRVRSLPGVTLNWVESRP